MKNLNRIKRLIGKQLMYHGNVIRISDYYEVPEEKAVKIITDKKPIQISIDDIETFENDCLPVEESATQGAALEIIQENKQTITDLQAVLMDNIKKVQDNKDYIHQAKTINNSVNTLLNMVKLRMQMTKKN